MAAPLIVEVLDSRGRVHSRTRLDRFPAGIGRGYANDVILDDPYADAEHLRVVEDGNGTLVAEDAGSVNGMFEGKNRSARVPIRPGLEIRVGHTTLRFQDPAQSVRPALVDMRTVPDWTTSGKTAFIVAILAGTFYALNDWLGSYERTTAAKQVNSALGALTVIALWAGLWSLPTRVNRHRFNFNGHFVLAGAVFIAVFVVESVSTWFTAMFPTGPMEEVLGYLVQLPLAIALIAGHLALASMMTRRARIRSAVFIILGVLAVSGLKSYADRDDFNTDMKYNSAIRPVPTSMVRAVSTTKFFEETTELRTKVDSLAASANRKDEARDRR